MDLKMEIFQQMEYGRMTTERNKKAAEYSRKCSAEKEKAKLVFSIIGNAFIGLPILWCVLFGITML